MLVAFAWNVESGVHEPFDRVNTKNTASTYLKNESQTVWARNAIAPAENKKRKRAENEEGDETPIPVPALAPAEVNTLSHLLHSFEMRLGFLTTPLY